MHDQKSQTQRPTLSDGHVTVRPSRGGDGNARLALGTDDIQMGLLAQEFIQ